MGQFLTVLCIVAGVVLILIGYDAFFDVQSTGALIFALVSAVVGGLLVYFAFWNVSARYQSKHPPAGYYVNVIEDGEDGYHVIMRSD